MAVADASTCEPAPDLPPRFTLVCLGEALFDVFPGNRHRLGGAPLNVAVHANQLAQRADGRAVLVTRVGQDKLGDELLELLRGRGLDTGPIQIDPDRPTGRVYVGRSDDGEPTYDIVRNAAWDMLWYESVMEDLAHEASAVCFGSLAQREAQTRNVIHRMLGDCRSAMRVFDVNLRRSGSTKFYDARTLRRSCEAATVVKCNQQELGELAWAVGVDPTPAALIKAFRLELFVLTRGGDGTQVVTPAGEQVDGEPASFALAQDADAVGAGDACTAAVMVGLALGWGPKRIADLANAAGAYVVSQPGGTPPLPEEILQRVGV